MPPALLSKVGPLLVAGLLAGGLPSASTATATTPAAAQRILVLYSNGRLLPANVEFDTGLRRVLSPTPGPRIEIFDEFLDFPRFESPGHLEVMGTYLRDKYALRPPNVLVAAGEEALRFLLQHRDDLFAGVPLVYSAVARTAVRELEPLPADVVGIPLEFDFAGTVTQAMQWHPTARRLWIVTGGAAWDRLAESRLRVAAGAFKDRLSVEFLSALPAAELFERLGDLGSDSIVFTPGFFRDGAGRIFLPRDSVEAMATVSTAPVYGAYSTVLGTGAVGGFVSRFTEAGEEAGRATAQLLGGALPSSLELPPEVPSSLHVDWRQIRRWKIDERSIPAAAIVHFREPTLFEAYRSQALLALVVLALQAALIGLLLEERRRRRAAEISEQGRRSELAHASRLAVAGELLGSIAHEINQPLGAILANADAADLILGAGGDRRPELASILANIRRDDLRASEVIRRLRTFITKHEVERRPFEVDEVAREIEILLRSEARRRRVTLEVQPARTATTIVGDRVHLQQVLINLVMNAMDAIADAPEERRIIVIAVRAGAASIEIDVRDRGPGIAPEHLPRLFDSFFTTKEEGMGLGLSIARTLVEAQGGRIWAESNADGGAVFHLVLPTGTQE